MKNKERLDMLLVERGLAETRSKAQALIMSGQVYVDNQKADKAGASFLHDAAIEVRGDACPYVSRGGLKLAKALRDFGVDPTGFVCSDSGASTGGFTDCLLQHGAAKVFAIDVGYGQLAWKLRTDERVVNMERTNIRYLTEEHLPDPVDFISIDVSFISLALILPVAWRFLRDSGEVVALIKPQFEAGRDKVGKKGVVRDPKIHEEVIHNVLNCMVSIGFSVKGISFSPVKGPEGNIEYLLYAEKTGMPVETPDLSDDAIQKLVEEAHRTLSDAKE